VGLPGHAHLRRARDRPTPAPPSSRVRGAARSQGGGPPHRDPEARHLPPATRSATRSLRTCSRLDGISGPSRSFSATATCPRRRFTRRPEPGPGRRPKPCRPTRPVTLRLRTIPRRTMPSDILGLCSQDGAASRGRPNSLSDQMPLGTHGEDPTLLDCAARSVRRATWSQDTYSSVGSECPITVRRRAKR
jgi:hypothetical protein